MLWRKECGHTSWLITIHTVHRSCLAMFALNWVQWTPPVIHTWHDALGSTIRRIRTQGSLGGVLSDSMAFVERWLRTWQDLFEWKTSAVRQSQFLIILLQLFKMILLCLLPRFCHETAEVLQAWVILGLSNGHCQSSHSTWAKDRDNARCFHSRPFRVFYEYRVL